MFNPARAVIDTTIGHGCGALSNCLTPIVNQFVFNLTTFPLLTLGDIFVVHSCVGLDAHPPVVAATTCSTRVFIKNLPVALASPAHLLSCSDTIIPNPSSRIFIGM